MRKSNWLSSDELPAKQVDCVNGAGRAQVSMLLLSAFIIVNKLSTYTDSTSNKESPAFKTISFFPNPEPLATKYWPN